MTTRIFLSLFVSLCVVPAQAAKPQIQWNPAYDFASVRTFAWRSPPEASLEQSNPFLHSRIVNAIEHELSGGGLTEVASNPDVFVTYHASTETDVSLQSTSTGYGFGGYGTTSWGSYGYRTGPIVTDTRVVEVERGTLVVDIWDAGSSELVWRGTVSGITVSDKPEKNESNAVKAIEKMAAQYRKLREREG